MGGFLIKVFIMARLYLIMLICAIITGAFFYGKTIGKSKCEIQNFQNQINQTEQIQQNKRNLNETVYKTGVRDIRRILRDKYTIAE